MNKKEVLEKIKKALNCNDETVNKINEVVESTFLIGKNNKDSMIKKFMEKLNISSKEADKIYNTVINIIGNGIKDKIKNPFKDLNK